MLFVLLYNNSNTDTSKLKIDHHHWLRFLVFALFVLVVQCTLIFFFHNDCWSKPDLSLIKPPYRYSKLLYFVLFSSFAVRLL